MMYRNRFFRYLLFPGKKVYRTQYFLFQKTDVVDDLSSFCRVDPERNDCFRVSFRTRRFVLFSVFVEKRQPVVFIEHCFYEFVAFLCAEAEPRRDKVFSVFISEKSVVFFGERVKACLLYTSDSQVIVSSGLENRNPFRIFNQPEIVIVDVNNY